LNSFNLLAGGILEVKAGPKNLKEVRSMDKSSKKSTKMSTSTQRS